MRLPSPRRAIRDVAATAPSNRAAHKGLPEPSLRRGFLQPPIPWGGGIDDNALDLIGPAVPVVECKNVPLFIEVRPLGFAIEYGNPGILFS